MFQCSLCPFFTNHSSELTNHLLRRHRNAPNFLVHCSYPGCGSSFKSYKMFLQHCRRKHFDFEHEVDEEMDGAEGDCDVEMVAEGIHAQYIEAQYLLKLKAGMNLSPNGIEEIVLSTKTLLDDKLRIIKARLVESVPPDIRPTICFDDLFQSDLFTGLETEHKQDIFFQKHLGYIKPEPVKMGVINKQVKIGGTYQYRPVDIFGYKIPFIKQLERVLSMPEVQDCLVEEIETSEKMLDFFDGTNMRKPYFQNHPDALLIGLYNDDFEIVNPIGSHRKKHKLSIFYWFLLNISPEYRFKVQATQLLAVARSRHVRMYGLNDLLSDFIQSLRHLHTGYNFQIQGKDKTMFGVLYCVFGDTLAAQMLGGFKEGVAFAEKPCRTCEIKHDDLAQSFNEKQHPLRNLVEHTDRCNRLNEVNKTIRRYWSRKWGITNKSILMQAPEFDVTDGILHDPMHVLLEGVVKLEIQLMLNEFINKKKYISLQSLNVAIKNFDDSSKELKDRPQELEMKSLDHGNTLPMTAIEIKNFMCILPFLIGEKIPDDEPIWKNFIRILNITNLVLSPIASDSTIANLEQLIHEHNNQFKVLYPEVNLRPKFHYMVHFPSQIKKFGPGRNHHCLRFEAKHSLFKNKKWRNFKSIQKSVGFYHQRWMCLQQNDNNGDSSDSFLYQGDFVRVGVIKDFQDLPDIIKHILMNNIVNEPSHILTTEMVTIDSREYFVGSVLVADYFEEPKFILIEKIYVFNHVKYFLTSHLDIVVFNSHLNSFECAPTNRKTAFQATHLKYKWPQNVHYLHGNLHVMLNNVDFAWC